MTTMQTFPLLVPAVSRAPRRQSSVVRPSCATTHSTLQLHAQLSAEGRAVETLAWTWAGRRRRHCEEVGHALTVCCSRRSVAESSTAAQRLLSPGSRAGALLPALWRRLLVSAVVGTALLLALLARPAQAAAAAQLPGSTRPLVTNAEGGSVSRDVRSTSQAWRLAALTLSAQHVLLGSRLVEWVETNGTVLTVLGTMFAAGACIGSLVRDLAAEKELRSKGLAAEKEQRGIELATEKELRGIELAAEKELRRNELAAEKELRNKDVELLSAKLASERELRAKDVEVLQGKLNSAERELAQNNLQTRTRRSWLG